MNQFEWERVLIGRYALNPGGRVLKIDQLATFDWWLWIAIEHGWKLWRMHEEGRCCEE